MSERELEIFTSAKTNRDLAVNLLLLVHQHLPSAFELCSLPPARACESLGPWAFQAHYKAHHIPTKYFSGLYEENCDIRFIC